MRRFLRMITALLTAWVECAWNRQSCLLGKIREILKNRRLNRTELAIIVLALSLIAGGLFVPVESSVIFDTLAGW